MNHHVIVAVLSIIFWVQVPAFPIGHSFPVSPSLVISRQDRYATRIPDSLLTTKSGLPLAVLSDQNTDTSSSRVRTMASFLLTQILEQTMVAVTKGESKLSEEDALALLATLQNASEAKNTQDATGSIYTAWNDSAEEAVEEKRLTIVKDDSADPAGATDENVKEGVPLLGVAENVESVIPIQDEPRAMVASPAPTSVGSKDSETNIPIVKALLPKNPVASMQQEKFQRSLLAARIQYELVAPTTTSSSTTTTSSRLSNESVTTPDRVLTTDEDVASSPRAALAVDTTSTSSLPTMTPRIPDVISKEFGKPLEVTASNVPALRDTSFPQRDPSSFSEHKVEAKVESSASEVLPRDKVIEESSAAVSPSEINILAKDSKEEATAALQNAKGPILESNGSPIVDNLVSASPTEEGMTLTEPPPLMTTTTTTAETVPTELRDASTAKQNQDLLSEKYKGLPSLEDKAFAILSDLGMVERRELSLNSKTEESLVLLENDDGEEKEGHVVESNKASSDKADTSTNTIPKDVEPSTRNSMQGVLQPIRSFFSKSRPEDEPLVPTAADEPTSSTAETSSVPTTQAIVEARRQPKSPAVEAALALKYGQILDLGDRAFAILKDLGMVL